MMSKEKQKKRLLKVAYEKILDKTKRIEYSDCLLAVEYDGQIISSIPSQFITEELCITALKNSDAKRNLMQYIPNAMLTNEFVLAIVSINGMYLKYLPIETINKNIIVRAVEQSINSIKYIPDKDKTDEIYKILIDKNPKTLKYIENPSLSLCKYSINKNSSAISFIKNPLILTDDIFKKVIAADWKNLKYVPSNRITKEMCDMAFNNNWKAFEFIPDYFKTKEMCEMVLDKDVSFVKYCPVQHLSLEICVKCVEKEGNLLEFIPEKFKSKDVCLLAIKNDSGAMRFLPVSFMVKGFFMECLQINYDAIRYFPTELKTFEVYKVLLNKIKSSKEYIELSRVDEQYTIKNQNCELYCELKGIATKTDKCEVDYGILKIERELHLRKTIYSCYDSDVKIFIVNEETFGNKETHEFSDFNEYYNYLCGDLNGANLTEYDFNGVDLFAYNMYGACLGSKILIEQGNYNGNFYDSTIGKFREEISFLPVLKDEGIEAEMIPHDEVCTERLNVHEEKFFYITDIHLNHRLMKRFPKYATFDEIKFFINKTIKKMVGSAIEKGYGSYLLIGGDVSFCFDISKIFYTELCNFWDPSKIVVVLGNHELWDCNCFGEELNNSSYDDVVEKYKSLFSELGIFFLQNSLLLKRRFGIELLSEKEILGMNEEKLKNMSLNCNLIIYGGIGFSAYNLSFNATHGIYRNTINSLETDLKHTRQTEIVYNKLSEIFSKEKVIVLSHMPPEDWSKRELVSNWIYVNGHTHNNHCIISDECTLYADNQAGYKSKNIILKYFKVDSCYDIFRLYSDGIYHITKTQYIDFWRGKYVCFSFNSEINDIIMMKRQEIYLFLLEDKENDKLLLLNGGKTNRLKNTDINYYYDNMLKYSDFIKNNMKSYNATLKNISDIIKRIGGDGRVHGCIVDIDFFNHIYLDPQNGNIRAYYSRRYGERTEYSTVEQLLDNKLPGLYDAYKKLIETSKGIVEIVNNDNSFSDEKHIYDTSQYKPSTIIKRIQFLTENNVIRIWNDEIVQNNKEHSENSKKAYLI